MRKIIFASHHKMADGLKSTAEYILGPGDGITAISAYLTNEPVEKELADAIGILKPEDEVLIFTDMLGGSVNQACVPYLATPGVHVITGMSLPVVMSVLLAIRSMDTIDPDVIRQNLDECRSQIVYVNDCISGQASDEEDE